LTCSSTIHRECIVAFPLQQWLLERSRMLRYRTMPWLLSLTSGSCKLRKDTQLCSFSNTPAVGVSWAGETANNVLLRWSFPPTSSVGLTCFRFKQCHAGQRTRPTSGPRPSLCLCTVMKVVIVAEEDEVTSEIELLLLLLLLLLH
jgi:hypothetical protein